MAEFCIRTLPPNTSKKGEKNKRVLHLFTLLTLSSADTVIRSCSWRDEARFRSFMITFGTKTEYKSTSASIRSNF